MALFRVEVKNISRGNGKSSVASSAYRNRAKYTDNRTGQIFDYSKRDGLYFGGIIAPENTPSILIDGGSENLWNIVENTEKRKDARLAKELLIALPSELTPEQNKALVLDFVKKKINSKGIIADVAIHDIDTHKGHVHIMLTTREFNQNGEFLKKIREWDTKETISEYRKEWQKSANKHLKAAGLKVRVDHRSLKEQKESALKHAESATEPKIKAYWIAKAIELDRKPVTNIKRANFHKPEFQKMRQRELEARDQAKKNAKETLKTIRDLDLQIIITPDEIRLEAPKPQPQEVAEKPLPSPVGPENQPQEAGPKAEPGTEVPNPVLGVKKQRWETFKDWFKSLVSSKPKAKPDADSDRFEVMRDPATGEMILKSAWKAGDVHDHHDKTPEKTATPEPVADRFKSVRQEADLTHNHKKGHTL